MAQRVDVQYIKFYTQGSAAARVQPAKPVHTATLPKSENVPYTASVWIR